MVRVILPGLLILVLAAGSASAQTGCVRGEARGYLDAGMTGSGHAMAGGSLWRPGDGRLGFEAPIGSGRYSGSVISLMVSGRTGATRRLTGSRGGLTNTYPGRYGATLGDCSAFDRIWSVKRTDVDAVLLGGSPTPDMLDWPADAGAPWFDRDGDPSSYNALAGDVPAVVGGQSLWWIRHDGGPDSTSVYTLPQVGLEIVTQVSAVHHTPFSDITGFRWVLRYEGSEPLEDAVVSVYVDLEIGRYDDDHVGVDTVRQVGYHYDDGPDDQVGTDLSAYGFTLVRGPTAPANGVDDDRDGTVDEAGERMGISSFVPPLGHAEHSPSDLLYETVRGTCWQAGGAFDGGSVRFDLAHPDTFTCSGIWGSPTDFWLSGNPITGEGWSERGMGYPGNDGVFLLSSGPFTMMPGAVDTLDFALIWSKHGNWSASLEGVWSIAEALQSAPGLLDPSLPAPRSDPGTPSDPGPTGVARPYPSPADAFAVLEVDLGEPARIVVDVFDVFGRRVRRAVSADQSAGSTAYRIHTADLPSGAYLYRATIGRGEVTGTLVVVH